MQARWAELRVWAGHRMCHFLMAPQTPGKSLGKVPPRLPSLSMRPLHFHKEEFNIWVVFRW